MWPFTKKEGQNDKNIRIDVEDLTDQGYSCKEISEELNIPVDVVYRIKSAKERRVQRLKTAPDEQSNPIRDMEIEIKKMQLERERQRLQWELEDRQADREADLADMAGDITDGEETPENILLKAIAPILINKIGSQTPQPPQDRGNSTQSSPDQAGVLTDQEVSTYANMIRSKTPKIILDKLKEIKDSDLIKIKEQLIK